METQGILFEDVGRVNLPAGPSAPQAEFDKHYITASEIARELSLTRVAIHYARQRGDLPNPISVGDGLVYIWNRDEVTPFIKAWKFRTNEKKGIAA